MITDVPLRIAVSGITGRMGKSLVKRILEQQKKQQFKKKIVLGAAITKLNPDLCGVDIGSFIKSSKVGIIITDNIKLVKDDFDVLIDFTTPDTTIEYLKFCSENYKNMVIGTTGLNAIYWRLVCDSSQKIGIVYSANFSIGITVMVKLLKKATSIIGNFVDIDIIETHHNKKNDIPSGTALMMRDVIEKNKLENNFLDTVQSNNIDCSKKLLTSFLIPFNNNNNNNINIHSIRSGDITGEHSVLFSGAGERLEITHKAFSRIIFVDGALYSAIWLGRSKVGLFDLNHVLKI